jgi:FAD/FMN-containing dehydrogenase
MMNMQLEGTLVRRGEAAYEEIRRGMLWNALTPGRFPEVIASVACEQDVVESVKFARENNLRIAIRGGGHSFCGSPLRDGGMLIDLSQLRELSIDSEGRMATVQPGITGRQFADALAEHGLAFPVGHCGSVPMSGYLLCGGFGWNMGTWGPACFSVRGVDVVTASGECVTADADRHPDLFWAARGAGPGFFGVATRFHVSVYPLPSVIRSTTQLYPLPELEQVSRFATALRLELPRNVELVLLVLSPPPAAGAPPGARVVGLIAAAFVDSEEEAAQCLSPLEHCPAIERALWRQTNEPTSIGGLQDVIGTLLPEGYRFASDAIWSEEPQAAILPGLAECLVSAPSPNSLVIAPVIGQPPESGFPDCAFSMVRNSFFLCYAMWQNPAQDNANVSWLRETTRSLEPVTAGHYIAETDLPAAPSRSTRAFAPANWARLCALRAKHDPEGLFHSFLGGLPDPAATSPAAAQPIER